MTTTLWPVVPKGDGSYWVKNYPRRWRGFDDPELWIVGGEPDDTDGEGDEAE